MRGKQNYITACKGVDLELAANPFFRSLMSLAKLVLAAAVTASSASGAMGAAATQQSTPTEYQAHLQQLEALVADCTRDTTKCLASNVGPDNEVIATAGARHVSYAWLRNLLGSAASLKDPKSTEKERNAVAGFLKDAAERLQQEEAPDAQGVTAHRDALVSATDRSKAKHTLDSILAASEFKHVVQPNLFARALNRILQWLDRRLAGIGADPRRARWLMRLFLGTVVLGACTGLIWWFVAQTKRQGLGIIPSSGDPDAGGVSIRDWRRWRDEAQELSQAGRWREAVHGIYWAAISRLESRGLWPANRTRTPREYLSVLRPENIHRSDLAALTSSFERIWYGYHPAGPQEYEQARLLLERLTSR